MQGISLIQPGDVIGFSGCNWRSAVIRVGTCGLICCGGVSHVGLAVAWPGMKRAMLCESTSLGKTPCWAQGRLVDGVQVHLMRQQIATYRGRVWHYPLARPLSPAESRRLTELCREYLGVQYDWRGAIGARHTPFARLFQRKEDLDQLFCSEWVVAALRALDRFHTDNASAWSPNGVVRAMLRHGDCRSSRRLK